MLLMYLIWIVKEIFFRLAVSINANSCFQIGPLTTRSLLCVFTIWQASSCGWFFLINLAKDILLLPPLRVFHFTAIRGAVCINSRKRITLHVLGGTKTPFTLAMYNSHPELKNSSLFYIFLFDSFVHHMCIYTKRVCLLTIYHFLRNLQKKSRQKKKLTLSSIA